MDYCSACRRHLNGALVCPGCGVCASPDLAPMPVRTSPYAVRQPGDEDVPAPRSGRSVPPPAAPHRPAEAPSGRGRAVRRREQSRWRNTRRRAALATAVALVGGGLTLAAALNHQPADRTRPTAAQGEQPMGGTGPEATAGLPVPTASPTGRPTAAPSTPPHTSAKPPAAPRSTTPTPRKATPKAAKPSPSASPSTHPYSRPLLPLPHDPAPVSTTPLTPPRQSPTPTKPTPSTDATTPTPAERTDPPSSTPSAPQSPAPTDSHSPAAAPSTSPSPSHVCLLVLCLG
ncbi:SCO2400 family protein [Streptomyces griseoluteus]|uniref:SCO2400 family protein n=1 Tax=Streptomyces griseoluteus TaxID=29306 RepID=UPI0036FC28BB